MVLELALSHMNQCRASPTTSQPPPPTTAQLPPNHLMQDPPTSAEADPSLMSARELDRLAFLFKPLQHRQGGKRG